MLVTKFGQTGIVNLGKIIPVAGAVVDDAFDFTSTKVIVNVAYKRFIGNTKTIRSQSQKPSSN